MPPAVLASVFARWMTTRSRRGARALMDLREYDCYNVSGVNAGVRYSSIYHVDDECNYTLEKNCSLGIQRLSRCNVIQPRGNFQKAGVSWRWST